ncbi:DUF1849 domain-containing protein [Mesorhizobium hawassense]|uniref:DUF1849 domain-containing protein n=1 Tax=Mesorhizobium hawassense TaxID=1209954 RepID=A0A330H323_9HYPH|nr:cell envelope integrity EipB family protein [Mesorhizobium hawassense]RAZ82991.1 DUF1849 domain-containing protein [Mesorhizobium hawassense]
MRATRLSLSAVLLSTAISMAPAFAVPALQAHRAVYDLSLNKASDRSGITGILGRMVYEFNGSPCEGYTVRVRFIIQVVAKDNTTLIDHQTTTFEDAEGKTFSFLTKSFVDQNLDKEVEGMATRGPKGLKVDIDKPLKSTLELGATRFPTSHLVEMIDKAEKGENFYQSNLFDGSEDANKVVTTAVVLGEKTDPDKSDPEAPALAKLATDKYWPVDIAYFDDAGKGGSDVPEYRVSFKLHENGITRDLVMDYGGFSMTGKLVNLSLFDQTKPCPASKVAPD